MLSFLQEKKNRIAQRQDHVYMLNTKPCAFSTLSGGLYFAFQSYMDHARRIEQAFPRHQTRYKLAFCRIMQEQVTG